MKKLSLLFLLGVLALSLSACGPKSPTNTNLPAVSQTEAPAAATTSQSAAKSYTLSEVAQHASPSDCWAVINAKVYDISPYIATGLHPGGAKINQACGQEATAMFEGVGKHQGKATNMLSSYYLGQLQ